MQKLCYHSFLKKIGAGQVVRCKYMPGTCFEGEEYNGIFMEQHRQKLQAADSQSSRVTAVKDYTQVLILLSLHLLLRGRELRYICFLRPRRQSSTMTLIEKSCYKYLIYVSSLYFQLIIWKLHNYVGLIMCGNCQETRKGHPKVTQSG